jgi:xylulokinase
VVGAGGPPMSFDALCDLAARAPLGSGGVAFMPWLAGERSPVDDHGARGSFTNLSVTTDAAEVVRSVLEGVAYNTRWLLQAVERFTGHRLAPLRMVGGGAQSDVWCQIYADVLDRPVEQLPDPRFAQLRGMALMAGVALGEHRLDEVDRLVPTGRRFDPVPPAGRGAPTALPGVAASSAQAGPADVTRSTSSPCVREVAPVGSPGCD